MPTPQAIAGSSGPFQYHLEFTLLPDVSAAEAVRATADLWNTHITGTPYSAAGPNVHPTGGAIGIVIGFGPMVWQAVAPHEMPVNFGPAVAIEAADGRGVPATQRDLWVWLSGSNYDAVVTSGLRVVTDLAKVATVAAEQVCFVRQDNRTWEGFLDGTENPGPFDIPDVAYVPADEPGAGGSTVIVQRWINDAIDDFDQLSEAAQEAVFGRTKRDSIELRPLPPTSHVARNLLIENGVELDIYRRNIPFGTVSERGYIFVGFAADQSRVTRMLQRMYGADAAPGAKPMVDEMTKYTRPVSSSSYFVPSLEALGKVGAAPESD